MGEYEGIRSLAPLERLNAIENWVATAPARARLDRAFRLLLWNMHSSAWDIAKAISAAAHSAGERLTYADLYAAIDNWRDMLAEERVNAVELSGLLASADQPESRRQITRYVAKARLYVRRRGQNYPYFFTRFDALKIRPNSSELTIERDPRALCAPLQGYML